ncbi:hypothetical protein QOZ80_2BG0170790 [Eleusine coracana subsp. coracana]|nr:hypothetical protein QOZ80_2BG0170790 [Eleusine coracana subsp. coracana]
MNPTSAFYPARPRFAMPPYAPPFLYPSGPLPPPPGVPVRSVWADNLDAELGALRYFAARAHSVAVTVHYPGVVHRAEQDHSLLTAEERYAVVKANVDALKPLQVGLAVATHDGRLAAWEFNLSGFNPAVDPCAAHSVAYLAGRGLDVDAHAQNGVPVARLTAALRGCGLVHRRGLTWIAYTGAYHVAYLIKVITGGTQLLPDDLAGFLAVVRRFLGEDVYDAARLANDWPDIPVGLERIAARLGMPKPLLSPQLAGAGSVLALQAYMSLRLRYFGANNINKHRGVIQGLQAI